MNDKFGELRDVIDAIECPRGVARQGNPGHPGDSRDRGECQDEAIANGAHEERFRRPYTILQLISRAAKLMKLKTLPRIALPRC